eukprot:3205191-Rhodomonas_salina.1
MALQKQLEEQQLRLHEELREKEEDLKRLKKKKEDVGVELYGVQQQLARMQVGVGVDADVVLLFLLVRDDDDDDDVA